MPYRKITFLILITLCLISVSRASIPSPAEASYRLIADSLARQDYHGAREAALRTGTSPERDFMLGVASYHMKRWDEAERILTGAADVFPLLGDFALYYRATALTRLSRFDEAIPLLKRLPQDYPQSPLRRSSEFLAADILFLKGDFQGAIDAYLKCIEIYPSGEDALKALHQSALCRERLGDLEGAARDLRGIWLAYPSKKIASTAEADLTRLRAAGARVAPYSAEELFRRGATLFDLRRFRDATATFSLVTPDSLPENLRGKLEFRRAMALYRSRKYQEAEHAFVRLSATNPPYPEYAAESSFWHAKLLERSGREKDALAIFQRIAEISPRPELAGDALLQAALIMKKTGRRQEALDTLARLLNKHPDSPHAPRARWETAWSQYQSGDYSAAAANFEKLAGEPASREKALYWTGRSREQAGLPEAAMESYTTLVKEYPSGYYTLNAEREHGLHNGAIPSLSPSILSTIPLPPGFERARVLASMGLRQEARMELASLRRRKGVVFKRSLDVAAIYLSMEDYRYAMGLFDEASLAGRDSENRFAWAILYPPGFSSSVSRYAPEAGISEYLTYALIRAESTFSPSVISSAGAVGLMQLMPATARDTARGLGETITTARLQRPDLNVRLGTRYLKQMLARFNGNRVCAVTAYNAGASPVSRWLKKYPSMREDEFIESIPYPETREYVKKVLAAAEVYRRLYAPADQLTRPTATPDGVQKQYSSTKTVSTTPVGALPSDRRP